MIKTEISFEELYSNTKVIFEENKVFLKKLSIILSIFGGIVGVFLMIPEFYSIEILKPSIFKIIDYTYQAISYVISFSILIFLFNKSIKKDITFSESIKKLFSKIIPLILTTIIFIFLIIPLYLAFIIPGIIFSILWMFFSYAVLFRNINYYSALKYSKSLISGKKMSTVVLNFQLFFKLWKYWLSGFLILIIGSISGKLIIDLGIEVIGFLIIGITTIIASILNYLYVYHNLIFLIQMFLRYEKEIGISNELLQIETNNSQESISQQEQNAKQYIETYKSQYPRDSIKIALMNTGLPESEVEEYLNKYF
jgi:hypothetical protein